MTADHTEETSPRNLTRKTLALLELIGSYGKVAVAFSAGVDSTVVAKAAQLACGEDAVAVTAVSPSVPEAEVRQAVELAEQIGIRHQTIETTEFDSDEYRENAPDRCWHCKTELYAQIQNRRDEFEFDAIVNGANVDDQGDYRPGMLAAEEFGVKSPLIEVGITKDDVRALAKRWALPVWDKPASPCLSSRIAYGIEVTPERVERVEQAEAYLKKTLELRELRVRCEANDLARIEVPIEAIPRVAEIARTITMTLRQFGFRYVTLDLTGFRSGSMNAVLPLEDLVASSQS
ncbi:ATP-dependent sacrificial sulfur transferase LarE [Calycomorphotria hydatis]|uniref:tRNA-specific 2-thiouridylase MnmA n=1 Tax=Calycomorphotria hydatis TaxID=2528027 RepID=A0A517TCD3_9PLAN|nr:ATP-dependent sacrificial sulfur transferase LarE [Calycomorphotria hydatis]QDT66026.1 tRNA-specific 2-thiouridylase MnmA [Calycomorphotria hydatis]